MFKNIIFTQIERKDDVGRLIEAMIFYQKAIVITSPNSLGFVLQHFGISETLELIAEGYLELRYCENAVMALTNNSKYDVGMMSTEQYGLKKVIGKSILDNGGIRGSIQKEAVKVADQIKFDNCENPILESSRNKILDQYYILEATRLIIKDFSPTYRIDQIVFNTQKSNKMIEVESNLDLHLLNSQYQKNNPDSSFSIASIFAKIVDVESEIYFSSKNNAELSTKGLSQNLICKSIDNEISKIAIDKKRSLDLFQDQTFNCRNIGDAYNRGLIDFKTLLEILNKSKKFKEWLSKKDCDQDLLKEYIREIGSIDFISSLPAKVFRLIVFSILFQDYLSPPNIGLMAAVTDSFIVDKIFKGWKPSQFINCINSAIKE